ncbi:probable protein phosphatase 2C 12 isoform X1 [Amborella trichopoda]|nr:probable protein phosphatase 2C 12 isoform X1 [Amborella trichopoda]XP_020517528.1 probable protein phosphatase 2C 12 isoform X1 [Amborella trichopoda]XP_020517529.1 probable protein phosphatase 2C 12 isoform X1 [Amborella trichopoda]|eukprot:XP_006829727.2 probable protein phosphatase 2C 12 isoform X1 [Amborella trichopoda]
MCTKNEHMVPLAVLLKRELTNEKIERPDILHGQASQSKKGEDFTLLKTECQRILGDGITTFSVFALFDGHNGSAAAIYTKENLLNNVLSAVPSDLSRDEWLAALPRALVAGFVKTDKDFQEKAQSSGTTVTFVIIDGWVVTVASVGDSRCFLESAEGSIYSLSADHRLEANAEERERITASGGEVGRMNIVGGAEIGPLRCWPGGLCLSRSIGDMDIGEFIVPVPYVKQVKMSNAGGRLVIASDGVWDALSPERVLSCCRGLPAEIAAKQIVDEALKGKGLRDDTTCIVTDLLPPEKIHPMPPPKKLGKGKFKGMFRRKSSESSSHSDKEYCEVDLVEEIYEEGSAMLAERLDSQYPLRSMFKLFACAVCQVVIKQGEGISLHAGSSRHGRTRPWDGPFLCKSCQMKKDAMEGKRPSADGASRHRSGSDDALPSAAS